MEKIVSVVMAAVMVCMSTAGCSGQKPAETGSSQTAAGSESASPEGMAGAGFRQRGTSGRTDLSLVFL